MDQSSRFPAAEISRRGAHPPRNSQRRNAHRADHDANRRRTRYRPHAAEIRNRDRAGRNSARIVRAAIGSRVRRWWPKLCVDSSAAQSLPAPQDNSQASFAPPLKKEEGRIDWSLLGAANLQPNPRVATMARRLHVHSAERTAPSGDGPGPRPTVAASFIRRPQARHTRLVRFLQAAVDVSVACGDGTALQLEFVQLEGRKRITALEFANGARLKPGDRFGS